LEESLLVSAREGRPWSLLVDGDVLLRQGALKRIVEELEAVTGPFYLLDFMTLDRGFGGPAYAGVHGYTTSFLEQAAAAIETAVDAQRPETRLVKEMRSMGVTSLQSPTVVGLHDYDQYFRDLYRKYFVRGFKFRQLANGMFRRLREGYADDPECRVMLWGFLEGFFEADEQPIAPLDTEYYVEKSSRLLTMLGLKELAPLPTSDGAEIAERLILEFVPDALFLSYSAGRLPHGYVLVP
jgi:hypothetical protein